MYSGLSQRDGGALRRLTAALDWQYAGLPAISDGSRPAGPGNHADRSGSTVRSGLEQIRILLVEDNEDDAALVAEFLRGFRSADVTLLVANCIGEARERLAERFDLVLLDLGLPDGEGVAALRKIQRSAVTIPTVVLTGMNDEFAARACLEAGADDYVQKDELTERTLSRAVEFALARARARDLGRRLEHADRLAAVGKVAAGVAHEVNNPASFVRLNTAELMRLAAQLRGHLHRGDDGSNSAMRILDEMLALLDDNLDGIDRIVRVVDDLRSFSTTGGAQEDRPVDLVTVCRTAGSLVMPKLRHEANLVFELAPVPPVMGDSHRLGQVVVNLLLNAMQAIHEAAPAQHRVTLRTERRGDHAVISVQDTGIGMSPDLCARIFTPFFTTRSGGEGTGLGLSISLDIVRLCGGRIDVMSSPGSGSRFDVYLPLAPEVHAAAETKPTPLRPGARVARRVLLIDDEALLLRAVGRALGRHHDVALASSGAAALAMMAEGARFDVILCDLMMPGLDGKETVERIRKDHPEMADRILLVSGGAASERASTFAEGAGLPILTKPVPLAELLDAIEEAATGSS